MTQKLSRIPKKGARGMHVEMLQQKLSGLHYDTNGIDGIFGNGTETAVKKFQQAMNLPVTGIIDNDTLGKLDMELKTGTNSNPEIAITDIVDKTDITTTDWANRGKAVWGYYHGMALMFATLYARLKSADPIVKEMAKPLHADRDHDALKRFDGVFSADGMNHSNDEKDRLRHLFVLMFGLGVMESNGKYCAGIDTVLNNDNGESTEAGLFQTSYDIRSVAKEMLAKIFTAYRTTRPEGYLRYFAKGFTPYETKNYGDGDAYEFQKLSKECPAFAVEYTAVALRNVSNHWRPVRDIGNAKEGLQINANCDELLKQVQQYVDAYGFDGAGAGLAAPATAAPEAATVLTAAGEDLKDIALNMAGKIGQEEQLKKLFDKYPGSKANYWAVVDFNKPSNEKRLFVFDLKNRNYEAYLVAHGKKSGELYAKAFSNIIGSNQSSLGIYKTAETYIGKHGRSLRMDGLDAANSNVRVRDIVIHKAEYVVPDYEHTGRAGRSDGCLAVNPAFIEEVIDHLQNGSYIIAWHKDA